MEKKYVFSVVNAFDYHLHLFESHRRLSRDGLIPKDSDRAFAILGDKYVKYIENTGTIPEYSNVLDWVPSINS